MKLHNLAFIDTETTGTDPDIHEIIELAVGLSEIDQESVSRRGLIARFELADRLLVFPRFIQALAFLVMAERTRIIGVRSCVVYPAEPEDENDEAGSDTHGSQYSRRGRREAAAIFGSGGL